MAVVYAIDNGIRNLIGFTFSQDYIASTLVKHASISKQFLTLFALRFDPTYTTTLEARHKQFEKLSNI